MKGVQFPTTSEPYKTTPQESNALCQDALILSPSASGVQQRSDQVDINFELQNVKHDFKEHNKYNWLAPASKREEEEQLMLGLYHSSITNGATKQEQSQATHLGNATNQKTDQVAQQGMHKSDDMQRAVKGLMQLQSFLKPVVKPSSIVSDGRTDT